MWQKKCFFSCTQQQTQSDFCGKSADPFVIQQKEALRRAPLLQKENWQWKEANKFCTNPARMRGKENKTTQPTAYLFTVKKTRPK